jgi:hypothetical protein
VGLVQIGEVPNGIDQSFQARNPVVIRRVHADIVARICGVSSILLPKTEHFWTLQNGIVSLGLA